MYAIGVLDPNWSNSATASAGGVYLYAGSRNDGMGGAGLGAKAHWEHYGQHWSRWFVPLPYGVVAVKQPASVAQYQGRLYITGAYSYNTVIDEQHRMWKQGIMPPAEVPAITGGGTVNGTFAYFSWYDELTQERSALSKGLEIGAGTPRSWNNLPTRPPDDIYVAQDDVTTTFSNDVYFPTGGTGNRLYQLRPGDKMALDNTGVFEYAQAMFFNPLMFDRNLGLFGAPGKPCVVVPVTRATHLELWLQLPGDLPRLAMRVAIGTTTVSESTTLADLGEAFITSFQRFPRGRFNAIYHDRQVMAGDPENPDVIYLSALFYPERYEGLYFRTRNGAPVTGILATKDYCLVFTRATTYLLQGYTDTDYSFTVVDQSLGSVGHNCNVVIHGNPYVWTEKGPYMFNGQWHPLSPENRWTPVSELYFGGDPRLETGQRMIATDDPVFNTYIVSGAHVAARDLNVPYIKGRIDKVQRFFAVLDYTLVQPEAGGTMSAARLTFDTSGSSAYSLGEMNGDPAQAGIGESLEFMKFMRNRYGMGRLFHIGCRWNAAITADDFDRYWSFAVIAMDSGIRASNDLGVPDGDLLNNANPYFIRMPSRILTGFYYFDDTGAYPMESKSFKRLWFHMRRLRSTKDSISVYATPDSGFWNNYYNGNGYYAGPNYLGEVPVIYPDPLGDPKLFYALVEPSFVWTASGMAADPEPVAGLDRITDSRNVTSYIGDIILPILPDFIAGRGLWINVEGFDIQFHGFGGQFILGADNVLLTINTVE